MLTGTGTGADTGTDTATGILLLNLGTPDSAAVGDVRRYLREFLADPRVIDLPVLPRMLMLYLVILPFRPKQSFGGPLCMHNFYDQGLTDLIDQTRRDLAYLRELERETAT